MNRHGHNHNHSHSQNTAPRGRPVSSLEEAHASNCFEHFLTASTLKTIFGTYRNLCEYLHLKPNVIPLFYPKLKAHVNSWKAKPLWKKFDARANQKCYGRGKICPNTRVLVIGAGPCGLRTAIEAQLLGAKVVVVEKRDRLSRNNVLHLWPFVIEDLRALGAKKFFGKFCAGSIDHISIRQLQCILLKVALLLGVEIHTELSFENLIEPNPVEKTGWRGQFKPSDHPVSQYEFDVIIGADGKRNTLQGFTRKEFRGKLAIAITANFINKRTEAEARVEEISGVAFIFNQKFFKDLYAETGIDLENIVYYKDDTHYFVMTAKKQSLIDKGVIKQDLTDTERLLALDNVDRGQLMNYAREAADFSTNYLMPDLEFAVNHYGQADVAMFDFTSMFAADNASKVIERHGYKLLSILVGDSLLEPFWPTGSGCARGFLSSMDAAWAIRAWGSGNITPLEVVAERESIYRLLAQTTPENLNKDYKSYTLDPSTRYPNLNKNVLLPHQVTNLYDTDNPKSIELKPRPVLTNVEQLLPKKRRRRESHVDPDTLLLWIKEQIREHEDIEVTDITTSFKDGRVLCAILHHYRPDLLDYAAVTSQEPAAINQHVFDLLEKELGIPPVMTGEELVNLEIPDFLTMLSYLSQVYDTFRCEIPHIKHPKLELPEMKRSDSVVKSHAPSTGHTVQSPVQVARPSSRHKRHIDPNILSKSTAALSAQDRKARKRKTLEKVGASVEDRQRRLEEIVSNRIDRQNKRRHQRKMQTEQFIKSMQMLQSNCKPDHSEPFEDYSIFLYRQTAPNFEDRVKDLEKQFIYVPDRENRQPPIQQAKRETDEDFAARIKDLEDKWREPVVVEKKPKDLLRAIGKIETSDWNIKEIEKKIIENKLGKTVNKDKEKVPKWSREQFLARQNKMERQHLERQDSTKGKFAEIDKNIKQLEHKLKEGTTRDLNQRKVASITQKLVGKINTEPSEQAKPVQKSNSRVIISPANHGSEYCHFCSKRVYLMERLSAEGKFFHRGCFRCQYCQTLLRLGSYMYDREGLYGNRFYCPQHFGMPGELRPGNLEIQKQLGESPEKNVVSGVVGVDLLDRVQTPERVKFSNLSTGHVSSDHEESPSPIDEDEWTDRNFRNSLVDTDSSEDDSSSSSDSDSEDDEAFEEALEEPPTKEGTMRWAERYKKRYSRKHDDDSDSDEYSSSDHFSYYENSSGEDESDTATEGEEEIRARELRKQEVCVEPPVTDTGTDTEIASDETSSETTSDEIQNSATEISTDSEFAQDDPTPTHDKPPSKIFDDFVTKTRGNYSTSPTAKKVQVKSSVLQQPVMNGRKPNVELKFTPLVVTSTPSPVVRKPTAPPTSLLFGRSEGYALNRTQSTGGIAAKVSLELKKKYLLGEMASAGSIQKSGSASTLDLKFKSFHTNISDCQKLLKPAPEISASMQVFCNKLNERSSPLSPTFGVANVESKVDVDAPVVVVNESEGRPRSPVHERSIVVPKIDWEKNKQQKFIDSLSSSDSELEKDKNIPKAFDNIPRLEIHDDSGEILQHDPDGEITLDSLNVIEPPKEKKTLNAPKQLPPLEADSILPQVHSVLHVKERAEEKSAEADKSSGRSTPSNIDDVITAALTETELSDWARDGNVSDDFDYELNHDVQVPSGPNLRTEKGKKVLKNSDLELKKHVCGFEKQKLIISECVNDVLYPKIENIEFMDTGTETSSDENFEVKNNGYVQFHDEDEFTDERVVAEARNANLAQNVRDETLISKQNEKNKPSVAAVTGEIELETGTTTEENTCSDSTVKNITATEEKKSPDVAEIFQTENNRKRLEDKLAQIKEDMAKLHQTNSDTNVEFDEHCQRLQSKIEFGNVKDSIDIRKSRRKSKPDLIQQPQSEKNTPPSTALPLTKLYSKEEIEKERNLNQQLIQEMVMNKMRAQNKSLERKKRNRNSFSPIRPFELAKSATVDLAVPPPDVLLSTIPTPLQKSQTTVSLDLPDVSKFVTPKAPPRTKNDEAKRTAEKMKEDARARARLISDEEFGLSPEEKLNKLRQMAQTNKKSNKENESPFLYNDTLKRNASFRRSKSGETHDTSFDLEPVRTKSVSEINRPQLRLAGSGRKEIAAHFCKSDPNLLLDVESGGKEKKKAGKDRERRKSITKFLAEIFSPKKKDVGAGKNFLSRISPKGKNKSKDKIAEEKSPRRNSVSEADTRRDFGGNISPPPVPPLPDNYSGGHLSKDECSSDAETTDFRLHAGHSSCDTLDQSGLHEGSLSSFSGRRSGRSARKALRQAQLKRHRMAQEIQRKMEETEVKTRELERRGVVVEKALRGEVDDGREEAELLREWFDLMRDRTELRRYERELTVRAQELELEDRHSRLQHELRERLENNEPKTREEMETEGSIIKQMMEIVAKRDSLIEQIEEDRLRYVEEDRDFEEQMLAKGINLTPLLAKSPAEK